MMNLLKADMMRLFKSMIFKLCVLFSAGASTFFVVSRAKAVHDHRSWFNEISAEFSSPEGLAFNGAMYLMFAMAALISIFVGTEYSDGTVRNKLICGHKRISIYMANVLTISFAGITLLLIYIGVTMGLGSILLPRHFMDANKVLLCTIVECAGMLSFSAIITLVSTMITNRSVGAVAAMLLTLLMLFCSAGIYNTLHQPEFEEHTYIVTDPDTGEDTIETELTPNPKYIGGTARKIVIFIDNTLPFDQLYQLLSNYESSKMPLIGYSALLIVLVNGTGLILYDRKDLK